ncbi:MAG: hypothetical protein V4757_07750 [Pseudomonadota bacterium]
MSHPKSKKKLMEQAARANANADHSGKVENDRNKPNAQGVTQKNEPQRSPLSRNDRESQIGTNQSQARRGSVNSGVR